MSIQGTIHGEHPHVRHHPGLVAFAMSKAVGHDEAEDQLRGKINKDPEARRIIAEIDQARADHKARVSAYNLKMAEASGLSPDQVGALVTRLAENSAVFTWLTHRVHLHILRDRPPEAHE